MSTLEIILYSIIIGAAVIYLTMLIINTVRIKKGKPKLFKKSKEDEEE